MKKIIFLFFWVLLCENEVCAAPRFASDNADLAFSTRLLKDTFTENQGNFVVSPFSVYVATALLANGAQGQTLDELSAVLGSGDVNNVLKNYMAQKSNRIEVNNSIWGSTFKNEYVDSVQDNLSAEVKELPKNTAPINVWIEEKTKGRTKKLIDNQMTEEGDLILVNTIYFKDSWRKAFDAGATQIKDFYSLDKTVDKVN